ncbi:vacuolar amino acid permease [Lentinula edodes]|uniref:Vacuolar amino acid permease n=1 Tax=Lentinula lateritia TaxID=40482 RepID=A0A9W8ZQ09_9AGAR|nr:vacuolar amino acid permease [Lentinula edodes]KAJ4463867.1 vacuolar amino acid permease [Lentinula edodes]
MSTSYEREPLLPRTDTVRSKARLGPHEISRSTRYGILAGIWMATFLSSVNMSLVPTMLPSISSEFQKSHQASWLGTAYLLATSTFTPLYGRLANVLGRRGAAQVAVLFTGLGTVACGLSTNMEMLIASRFLAGIGGGGINTIATIIVSDMYTLRERGLAQGVASVFNGFGLGFGGPLGGLITDWFGWRWAFLCQIPLFVISLFLTSVNLSYVTKGKGKSTVEVLKRIDYFGSFTVLISVGSMLMFLSTRFNANLPWSDARVIVPLVLSVVFFVAFIIVEIYIAPEPVLAPFLLKQKIPVLVGISNFLVATCNFTITYFFPMWFQTVMLTNASTAGLHILPNSISMSSGSVFAGWMMHRTGKYKMINMIFGIFPFIGTVLISQIHENSGWLQSWFSIIPMGFGNAVVLQTMLIALLAHIPESHMAVGTGFGQLFRGIGQVGGVAISSAIFQWKLDSALRERIHDPDAEKIITHIRQNARAIGTLPPRLQRIARDSYAVSLKSVFFFASVSTLMAYLARLPIPEKDLDSRPRSNSAPPLPPPTAIPSSSLTSKSRNEEEEEQERGFSQEPSTSTTPDSEMSETDAFFPVSSSPTMMPNRKRRLSTFESTEGILDLESRRIGGSARTGTSVTD